VPPRAPRTLTQRELNRAVLARQLLLERAPISVPRALERMGGLQAQYAPSMYVGLWSRLEGLRRDHLTRLLERRTVVQGTLMRSTIHLVSRRDYWPMAIGTRAARRVSWLRAVRDAPAEDEMTAAATRLREALASSGSLRRTEVDALLGRPASAGAGLWLDLVRAPPSGTWERRRADLYAAAEDWIGPAPEIAEAEAVEHLIRRYLGAFGPATRGEIADWAGLTIGTVAPVLDRLALRRFRAEDGDELLDLPRAPLPAATTPAPVRFLPTWDATLLVHARRARILPEEHRARIFHTRAPQSFATFLVDGAVAGIWRYDDGRVDVEPFGPIDRAASRDLRGEAARLAAFHA
jgi:hypothetical protein